MKRSTNKKIESPCGGCWRKDISSCNHKGCVKMQKYFHEVYPAACEAVRKRAEIERGKNKAVSGETAPKPSKLNDYMKRYKKFLTM